jgi:hypothetical protein
MLDAGIVDENIEPAQLARRGLDHSRDLCRIRHVGRIEGGPDTKVLGDLPARAFDGGCFAKAIQHDIATGSSKRSCDSEADAARRSRHDRGLSVQHLAISFLLFQRAPVGG